MALGCQVYDAIHLLLLHEGIEGLEVADVHAHELVVGAVLHVLQVGKIAGIGEFVQVDDIVVGVLVHEQAYHMAAYESGSAGDDYASLHCASFIGLLYR